MSPNGNLSLFRRLGHWKTPLELCVKRRVEVSTSCARSNNMTVSEFMDGLDITCNCDRQRSLGRFLPAHAIVLVLEELSVTTNGTKRMVP